jgi:repressor LexA
MEKWAPQKLKEARNRAMSEGIRMNKSAKRNPTRGPGRGPGSLISDKAREVLEFIADSVHERGLPPTIREIGEEFEISSTNGVRYYLEVLERAGLIKRKGKISRGIEVRKDRLGPFELIEIPVLGRVAAGVPIFAEENIEQIIAVDKSMTKPGKLFALKVRGDSMKEAGLLNADIVIVRQQSRADSGDIVVALLGDEATVKRYVLKGGEVILWPENKEYEPMVVTEATQFQLIGRVIGSIRTY